MENLSTWIIAITALLGALFMALNSIHKQLSEIIAILSRSKMLQIENEDFIDERDYLPSKK